MGKFRVYITRKLLGTALDRLRKIADVIVHTGSKAPSTQELLASVKSCEGLITMLSDQITSEVIDAAGAKLRVISNHAVGFDNIDVAYATRKSIMVTNTPDVLTESTADLTWALLMAAARRLIEGDHVTRTGQWKEWAPDFLLGVDVHHKTLGIIGLGRIGLAVAKRAVGFEMRVLYHNRTRRPDFESQFHLEYRSLKDLLRESDFVSVHVPRTRETTSLIGREQLKLMKPSAILINAARGSIVDETALVQALKESRIKAAALDVYQEEPTRNQTLLDLPNVVLSPHLGSATLETRIKMADLAVDNLIYGLTNQFDKMKIVNPSVLKK
ncbi:MAG: D-glycerate dehydrogenase [Candidatus Helarchaeota archaeon]|nr:D-glycerate dehydrogenase [Candidatus Helarchaeota archaeon]